MGSPKDLSPRVTRSGHYILFEKLSNLNTLPIVESSRQALPTCCAPFKHSICNGFKAPDGVQQSLNRPEITEDHQNIYLIIMKVFMDNTMDINSNLWTINIKLSINNLVFLRSPLVSAGGCSILPPSSSPDTRGAWNILVFTARKMEL